MPQVPPRKGFLPSTTFIVASLREIKVFLELPEKLRRDSILSAAKKQVNVLLEEV